mmetsp:Transcript_2957/g.4478  ORF Transcript_2957/g.4478 Transcript_2957/m.4478 type:complete len:162 (-) Transcript_2957:150-635(-)
MSFQSQNMVLYPSLVHSSFSLKKENLKKFSLPKEVDEVLSNTNCFEIDLDAEKKAIQLHRKLEEKKNSQESPNEAKGVEDEEAKMCSPSSFEEKEHFELLQFSETNALNGETTISKEYSENEESIAMFMSATGSQQKVAVEILEKNNWDLNLSVDEFFKDL